MFGWLGGVWQSGLAFISQLFTWVSVFFGGLIYLLERIIQLAGLAVQVILLLTQVLFSVMQGVVTTFANLAAATPAGAPITELQAGFDEFRTLLDPMGFQTIGYLLAFAVWVLVALSIIAMF